MDEPSVMDEPVHNTGRDVERLGIPVLLATSRVPPADIQQYIETDLGASVDPACLIACLYIDS